MQMGLIKSIAFIMALIAVGTEQISADEIRVGCFPEKSTKAVCEYLQTQKDINAEFLPSKNWLDKIYDYDVLFLSSDWMNATEPLDSELRARLWEYVYRGHGLILAHDSYFGKWYRQVLFPEFQSPEPGVGQRCGRAMEVVKKNHPVAMGLPLQFYHCYYEHACFKPTAVENATVVCTDGEARPLVVAAEVGKGRVVAAGIFFALSNNEASEDSIKNVEKLLLNSICWVADGTKEMDKKDPSFVRPEIRSKLKLAKARYEADLWMREIWYEIDNELDYLYGRSTDLALDGSEQAKEYCQEIKNWRKIAEANFNKFYTDTMKTVTATWEFTPKFEYLARKCILPEFTLDVLRQKLTDTYTADGHLLAGQEKTYTLSAVEIETAMADLNSSEPENRAGGALEAGRMELKNTVPQLLKLLSDPNYEVQRNAVYALSWIRDVQAVIPLMAVAERDTDVKLRRRAVQALGMIGDKKASPLLLRLLTDKDLFIR